MPSHFYAATREDRLALGISWPQSRRCDPFGDKTGKETGPVECINRLAQRKADGIDSCDNDIIPFGASASPRDGIVPKRKKAKSGFAIKATMATTNAHHDQAFKVGVLTSSDPKVRLCNSQKVMFCIGLAVEMGLEMSRFWGGREGTRSMPRRIRSSPRCFRPTFVP